jgi:hypothetical protein
MIGVVLLNMATNGPESSLANRLVATTLFCLGATRTIIWTFSLLPSLSGAQSPSCCLGSAECYSAIAIRRRTHEGSATVLHTPILEDEPILARQVLASPGLIDDETTAANAVTAVTKGVVQGETLTTDSAVSGAIELRGTKSTGDGMRTQTYSPPAIEEALNCLQARGLKSLLYHP